MQAWNALGGMMHDLDTRLRFRRHARILSRRGVAFGPRDARCMRLARVLSAALACVLASSAWACDGARVKLQMLGTGGPELVGDRASTGYLIWLDGKARVIVDAGAGSLQRFRQSGAKFAQVELMLFTHFHVDHSADFPAYVKGSYFTDRTTDLVVVGPSGNALLPSASQFVARMLGDPGGAYPYLSEYVAPGENSAYKIVTRNVPASHENPGIRTAYQSDDVRVQAVPVHHGPLPALGYRVELAGCALSFSGDMNGQLGQMPLLAQGSDVLVAHNAVPEEASGAAAILHMKPSYIGTMAAAAGVKQLVLSHLMQRTVDRKVDTIRSIREAYKGPIRFPDDLDVIRP